MKEKYVIVLRKGVYYWGKSYDCIEIQEVERQYAKVFYSLYIARLARDNVRNLGYKNAYCERYD